MEALEAETRWLQATWPEFQHLTVKKELFVAKERTMVNWTKVYIPLLVEVEMKCLKTPIFSFLLFLQYVGAFMNCKDRIIAANI